jgi:GxxExxY protein
MHLLRHLPANLPGEGGRRRVGRAPNRARKASREGHAATERVITQRRKDAKEVGMREMTENEIATIVVDAAYTIPKHFGSGLHETVYEVTLVHELRKRGLQVERQKVIPIQYDSITFEEGFRADVIVEDKVVLELKAVEGTHPVHKRTLLTYLRLMDKRLGLLINFDVELIKDGILRVVNGLPEDY